MGYSERRHKEPREELQFYYDVRGIMARAEKEGVPPEKLKLRETGDERDVILFVIEQIGDIIKE